MVVRDSQPYMGKSNNGINCKIMRQKAIVSLNIAACLYIQLSTKTGMNRILKSLK